MTVDAMGCQKNIAFWIMEKEADYLLAIKDNRGNPVEQVEDSFRFLPVNAFAEELDCGHGRVETHRCSVISDLSLIESKGRMDRIEDPGKNRIGTLHQKYRQDGK